MAASRLRCTRPASISKPDSTWFVYILRCADGTLYTGIATDLDRRLREHNGDDVLGARYTRARRPVELAYREPCADRAQAAKREYAIKRLNRVAKLVLIAGADGDA
jgi:putative endonuclease